jgi:hypothetical protein
MRAGLLSSAKSKVPPEKGENFEDTWKAHPAAPPETNYTPDHTQLEKMGFVMNGIGNPGGSDAVAQNTARGADAAEQTAQFIKDFLDSTHPDGDPVHES